MEMDFDGDAERKLLLRRIELKKQLIMLTYKEIKDLEGKLEFLQTLCKPLNKKAATLAQGKTGNPEPAAAS